MMRIGPAAFVIAWIPLAATAADFQADHRAILDREAKALRALGDGLARRGDAGRAGSIRDLADPAVASNSALIRIKPLPEVVPGGGGGLASRPPAALDPEVSAIRDRAAEELFQLAGQAARANRVAVADACLRGVIDRQPDHSEARRLLGYVRHQGGWASPFAVEMLRKKKVDHPVFGWIDSDWVPRLEQGELPGRVVNGKPEQWLPAAQADAMRSDIRRGWEINTAHFSIRTDVPLDKAIAFGRKLEHFREAFHASVGDIFGAEAPLVRRFQNKSVPSVKPHEVWYFATKAEYVDHLRPTHGDGVELELGRYDPSPRRGSPGRSYFYRDDSGPIPIDATVYHEASHQILFESGVRTGYEGNLGQYWVFEGLGTYFETLEIAEDGTIELGGFVGPRLSVARQRIHDQAEIVPLTKLLGMNRSQFDGSSGGDVYLHYAQAMALAVFLMHGEGGRYRPAFLDYAGDAYRGNYRRGTKAEPLPERLGISAERLQEEFRRYLGKQPTDAG
ncbi:MAG: DUF1570 domain-containing protein [Isosphaeraceae bacterium]